MHCIYVIRNLVNGKVYVGKTRNFVKRKAGHVHTARGTKGSYVHRAMRKHGIENFVFEVLEECDATIVDEREKFWIAEFKSFDMRFGYNLTSGGEGGKILSEEVKHEISRRTKEAMASLDPAWKKRQREAMADPNVRAMISERTKANTPRGHHLPDELRRRISDTLTGRPLSDERKRRISEATRAAMALKREQDPEWAARQHAPMSEERRRKISDAVRRYNAERLNSIAAVNFDVEAIT